MKEAFFTYSDLQRYIDAMVGKFGLQKSVQVVESLIKNTELTSTEDDRVQLLLTFIVPKCIEVFNLQPEEFYKSHLDEYRDARMSCYHLLSKYTDISNGMIGENFGLSKRSIRYYNNKCDEILSIPSYYKIFVRRYTILEDHIINFISRLK